MLFSNQLLRREANVVIVQSPDLETYVTTEMNAHKTPEILVYAINNSPNQSRVHGKILIATKSLMTPW